MGRKKKSKINHVKIIPVSVENVKAFDSSIINSEKEQKLEVKENKIKKVVIIKKEVVSNYRDLLFFHLSNQIILGVIGLAVYSVIWFLGFIANASPEPAWKYLLYLPYGVILGMFIYSFVLADDNKEKKEIEKREEVEMEVKD